MAALADAKALYKRRATDSYFYTGDILDKLGKGSKLTFPDGFVLESGGSDGGGTTAAWVICTGVSSGGGLHFKVARSKGGVAVDREIDPLHFFVSSSRNPADAVLAFL